MSEAGCPGVADPGGLAVRIAQQEGFKVIPLVGPSSILLSLMGSGLNGQNFSFHGYLPIDSTEKEKKIRDLESLSMRYDSTQIFIETPYRNEKMFESLINTLKPDTFLCVASNVTAPDTERILTKTVRDWRGSGIKIDKVPTVFLIYCPNQINRKTRNSNGKKKNFI